MSINFNMDSGLNSRLEQMCAEFGLDVNTVMKMFITTAVQTGKIPFKINDDVLKNEIAAQKDRVMKNYSREINVLLNTYPNDERETLRSKIADDIYNIDTISDFTVEDYFKFQLYRAPKKEWLRSYISDNELRTLRNKINTPVAGLDMGDKYVCYNEFKDYYKREMVQLATKNDKYDFVAFVKKHNRVIIKPRYGASNLPIKILNYTDVSDWDSYVANIFDKYVDGIVAEEVIVQDDDMSVFNSSSVNTLRVATFTVNSKTQVFAFLRVGVDCSILDVGLMRSLVCRLDQNTGEILCVFDRYGNTITQHPNSNMNLIGLQVPDIKRVLKDAKKLAKMKSNYKYAAFDFARTNNQWVLVDFNNKPAISDLQLVFGKGFKQNILRLVCDEI